MKYGRVFVCGLFVGLAACSDGLDISGDGEAVGALREALQTHYANCSGKWTTSLGGRYHQIDGPAFTIREEALERAQELNGITWRGRVQTGSGMSNRRYEGSGAPNSAVWTRWSAATDGYTTMAMERRADGWRFSSSSDLELGGTPADCARVPAG